MKKRLLILLPVVIAFSAFTTSSVETKPVPIFVQGNAPFDLDDWVIDEATANRMIEYYGKCKGKCKAALRQTRNLKVKQELEKTFRILDVQTFKARYGSEDAQRYSKARGFAASDGKADVEGFTTVITRYDVVPKNGFLSAQPRSIFTDEYTICPPPDSPPCN